MLSACSTCAALLQCRLFIELPERGQHERPFVYACAAAGLMQRVAAALVRRRSEQLSAPGSGQPQPLGPDHALSPEQGQVPLQQMYLHRNIDVTRVSWHASGR